MNILYVIGGIGCMSLGVYITKIQVKRFMRGEQDNLGFDIKLLFGGIMGIILGIALIVHYI